MENERLPHDPAYKQFFSNPEMVESLLRDFVPEDFVRELDFSTLEQCSGSYVTDDLRERHDDIVWRLRWNGEFMYLYLLIEFQSSSDPWMAVRILAYTALLWQDLIKSGAIREGEALPPVFPMVIYNGRSPWTAARDVGELLTPVSGPLERYQPRQHYFLLDESQVSEELLHGGGLVAQLVRLERAREPEEVRQVVKELIARLHGPEYARLRRAFTVWLGRVVLKRSGITEDISELHDLREVDAMLEERAAQWKDDYIRQGVLMGLAEGRMEGLAEGRMEGLAEGRMEGLAEGRMEGLAEGEARGKAEGVGLALRDFLEIRFGALPPSVISSLATLSDADTLRGLTLSAYRAESLETFLEQLKKSASHMR